MGRRRAATCGVGGDARDTFILLLSVLAADNGPISEDEQVGGVNENGTAEQRRRGGQSDSVP